MEQPHRAPDPISDLAIELKLQDVSGSENPPAVAGPPNVCADLDRYEIAVVLRAIYEWGGYRYTNASDAIAAAKRAAK